MPLGFQLLVVLFLLLAGLFIYNGLPRWRLQTLAERMNQQPSGAYNDWSVDDLFAEVEACLASEFELLCANVEAFAFSVHVELDLYSLGLEDATSINLEKLKTLTEVLHSDTISFTINDLAGLVRTFESLKRRLTRTVAA